MSMLEDVADGLARRAIEVMNATGNEEIEQQVAYTIGASSPTLQEAFSTAMRVRKAEARAMEMMEKLSRGETVAKGISAQPQDGVH